MVTAYVNGQVIDGHGKAYKGYVIVDGDKIAEVGQGSPPSLGESVARQDLTSGVPGLRRRVWRAAPLSPPQIVSKILQRGAHTLVAEQGCADLISGTHRC